VSSSLDTAGRPSPPRATVLSWQLNTCVYNLPPSVSGLEQHDVVHAIEKLQAGKCERISVHHWLANTLGQSPPESLAFLESAAMGPANCSTVMIDDGVFEIHCAALTVGQPPVIEDLQQYMENIMVSLFRFRRRAPPLYAGGGEPPR